jgi:hypothetical protein
MAATSFTLKPSPLIRSGLNLLPRDLSIRVESLCDHKKTWSEAQKGTAPHTLLSASDEKALPLRCEWTCAMAGDD